MLVRVATVCGCVSPRLSARTLSACRKSIIASLSLAAVSASGCIPIMCAPKVIGRHCVVGVAVAILRLHFCREPPKLLFRFSFVGSSCKHTGHESARGPRVAVTRTDQCFLHFVRLVREPRRRLVLAPLEGDDAQKLDGARKHLVRATERPRPVCHQRVQLRSGAI